MNFDFDFLKLDFSNVETKSRWVLTPGKILSGHIENVIVNRDLNLKRKI